MSCSKSTLCSWEEESWWPMFVQLVYFSRPSLLKKACSSRLHPYKHTNILLLAFKEKETRAEFACEWGAPGETSLPTKGHGSRAAFVPAPAHPARSSLCGIQGPPRNPCLPMALAPQPGAHSCHSPWVTQPWYFLQPPARPEWPAKLTAEPQPQRLEQLDSKDPKMETKAGRSSFLFLNGWGHEMRRRSPQPARKKWDWNCRPGSQWGWIAQCLPAIHSLKGADSLGSGAPPSTFLKMRESEH